MSSIAELSGIITPGLIFVIALIVVIAVIRKGGTVSWKNASLSLANKSMGDPNMEKASNNMIDNLPQVQEAFYSYYLRLMKKNGCPEDILNENEDSEYFGQMLRNMVWSGNGIKSTKSILEKELILKNYLHEDPRDTTKNLLDLIRENWVKYINDNYRTIVNYSDRSRRDRIVSNKELYEALPDVLVLVEPIIQKVFTYAKSLYKRKND